MKLTPLALSVAIATTVLSPIQADDLADLKAQMRAMQQKIEQLEAKAQMAESNSASSATWSDSVTIGGVVEVEANSVNADTAPDTSDIYVATAELGISGKVNDNVSADIVLLYEGDGAHKGDIAVDTATITIAPTGVPVSIIAGKTAMPFGTFETNLLSDPITLSMGETKDAGMILAFESGMFNASAGIFNGTSDDGNDDIINDYAVSVGIVNEGSFSYAMQLGYMNNLGNSDGVTVAGALSNDVAAMTGSLKMSIADITFIGEYVGATDNFKVAELAHNGKGAKPTAWNTELGYSFGDASIAFGAQGTQEASAVGLAKSKKLAAASYNLYENTSITLEYAQEKDYADKKTKTLTGKLAVSF